ncbi:MAG TPA: TonB-dependent receptor, partial [Terriglobales bacterium]|nr:TonB-dependent receptor [Terriglobales bacterium]
MRGLVRSGLILFMVLGFLAALQPAQGQEVTAAVVGTVTDPSGAPIKDADVTVTDAERGTTWTARTNDAGAYNLPRLPVGSYTVKVTAPGFQTALHPAFTLVLNQTARVDVQMKVGQVNETVEVTTAAPVLQTETTQVSTVIDSVTNDLLPLATRNYVELTLLAPGSISPDPANFNNGDNTASGARPYINGNREQANNFILDGMDNNQVSDNLLGYTPAPDAIQEFNLITSNASAEFGNFQGGIVSTTIKSGTNEFHGDLWEYFRNDVLNSNQWENGFRGVAAQGKPFDKPKLRWNMFGGTIGGPIVKNKLFFFFDYQGQRFDHPSTTIPLTVFTARERSGDFGDLCETGFNGAGLCNPAPAGSGLHSVQLYDPNNNNVPFPNNVIGPIDPVAQALFSSSLYPTATGTDPYSSNASYTQTSLLNSNQYDIKIDFKSTTNDHLFGRFSHAKQHNPQINSFLLLGTGFSDAPIDNSVLDWSHAFSPTLLNDLRVGFNHVKLHNGTQFASSVGDLGNQLGIFNGNPAGVPGLLSITFNGVFSGIGSTGVQQKFQDAVIQASDTVIISRNRHVFHTGFEFWRYRVNTFYTGNNGALGFIGFTGLFTKCNPSGSTTPPASCASNISTTQGSGGADFVLGLPTNYGRGISGGEWGQRQNVFGAYIQDDWRATKNLTLNLGLRYEAHTPWVEIHDAQVNFDLRTGEVLAPNCSKVNLGTAPTTCRNSSRGLYNGTYGGRAFQPRIGLAWTPEALGGKTVIRSAFSISSYMEGTGTNLRLPQNPPFSAAETFVNYNGQAYPSTTTDQGLVPVGAASDPFAGALVRVWDPKVQPALTQMWNLTIQQQIGNAGTFQIGYVGQHGTHLMVPTPYLQKQYFPGNPCGTPPCTAPSVFFSGNPTFQSDISQISGTASIGQMKYNALQAVFQKRYTSGLEYQVAYTFSKCMTDNSGYYGTWGASQGVPAQPYFQNLYDPRADYAPCYFDAKHILSSYAVYELPFGRGKKFGHDMNPVANAVAGGWSVAPIISIHSGFPLALYNFTSDPSNTGSRGPRPNCGPGAGRVFGRKPAFSGGNFIGYQWFDPSPYTLPTVTEGFGDCPAQGPVRGPGYANVDFSLQKNFQITERTKLQFRTDFLNAFNHTNLNTDCCFTAVGPGMGIISSSQPARNIQFALK